MLELFKSVYVDKNLDTPLYIQLHEKIKELISKGTLVVDTKLPSVRKFSSLLGVNSVTVVSCYKLLETNGYVYTKAGSGTYVSNTPPLADNAGFTKNSLILDELYYSEDTSLISSGQIKVTSNTINFASATPSSDLFPVEDFKMVLNEVLERDKGNAFNYQDSQGFYPLRSSICSLLELNEITCSEDNIQIISGAQQGIDIIAKAILRQGDYVITESPTYTGAIAVFKSRGAQIADVEMDSTGLNMNMLEYYMKKYKPKLIYTIPSFQNPTGLSYINSRRNELLNLAELYNAYIIEDDYVSELDFENNNYSKMKTLDKNDRVIFIKSFSKLFMPGLRFGFMIVPKNLVKYVLEAKHSTDISTSGLIQRAFDLYIRKGLWRKHFNAIFDIYKDRYFKTIKSLDSYLPGTVSYKKPGGGLNIWLNLPYSYMANALFKYAAANDIVFAPGRIFYSSTSTNLTSIRLSYASVDTMQIESGISKLCELIVSYEKGKTTSSNMPIL